MRTARRAALGALSMLALSSAACSDGTLLDTAAPASSTTGQATTTVTSTLVTTTVATPTTTTVSTTTRAATSPTTAASGAGATSAITTRSAAPLFGVAIGAEAEGGLAKLIAALGQPTGDSGWDVGCTLDSPTLENERLVSWGHLRVLFARDAESSSGTLRGYGFVLPEGDMLLPDDGVRRLTLPTGALLGTPIGNVASTVGAKAQIDKVFGWVSVTTSGATFTADGDSLTAPLNAVSVPRVFTCE